jgi:hypothetical protein
LRWTPFAAGARHEARTGSACVGVVVEVEVGVDVNVGVVVDVDVEVVVEVVGGVGVRKERAMRLDDETLALLGYARPEGEYTLKPRDGSGRVSEVVELLGNNMAVVNQRDVGTRDIDGRHRRNWRHRRKS